MTLSRIASDFIQNDVSVFLTRTAPIRALSVSGIERRKEERFFLTTSALLSVIDESGAREGYAVMTQNISSGGAFLSTDKPITTGASVKIDIVFPLKGGNDGKESKTRIDVTGIVVRTEKDGIAILFSNKYKIIRLSV